MSRGRRQAPRAAHVDPPVAEGDLLKTSDRQRLPVLDGAHELRRFQQAVAGSGVEPCETAPEPLNPERACFEVGAVDIGDLKLPARRRFQRRRDVERAVVVDV